MDPRRQQHKSGLSYSNLFNLEPLMNFQLPQPGSEFGSYGNSSLDESTSSQGQGAMTGYGNGNTTDRSSDHGKRRERHGVELETGSSPYGRRVAESNDQDEDDYNSRISEKHYRSMLGEHVHRYRGARFHDSSLGVAIARVAMSGTKRIHSSKGGRFSRESLVKKEAMYREMDNSPEFFDAFESDYNGGSRYASPQDSSYLDIGEGITYMIPPTYDKLAISMRLPSFSDIRIDEYFLEGTLDLRSLAAFVASDRTFEAQKQGGLADPQRQYESLQARLKALSASNSNQKFTLQVCDMGLDSIPEGAAGRIRCTITSESGVLQVYYVRVLEKGDTYEIIERSLPKKHTVKKDPSVIEKEEMDKIGKVWVNIVRRDIPRYHRAFTNLHKKQLVDAKRFSEACQREENLKVGRSIKLMNGAAIRTKKFARDMLLFWKRVDKEQEELREAKRQQQRLNFLLSQTELYSHFMQNKSQPSETLATEDGVSTAPEEPVIADEPGEEEGSEEVELRKEALNAAQNAVSQQKKITNLFDSECLKLRQAAETTDAVNDPAVAGSSNMDLLNPIV